MADGSEALWHAYWRRFTEGQALKKAGRSQEALDAFLLAVDATERQAAHDGGGVAPAPYHEAAILFRRLGDLDGELALLEQFARQQHANGVTVPRLLERLEKVRARAGVTAPPPAPNPAPGTTRQPDDPFRARRFRSPPPPPNPQQLVQLLRAGSYFGVRFTEPGAPYGSRSDLTERPVRQPHGSIDDLADLGRRDPPAAAALAEAAGFDLLACDLWLLAGDPAGALEALPAPPAGQTSGLATSHRLNLKRVLGLEADPLELLALTARNLTDFADTHLGSVTQAIQAEISAVHASGRRVIDQLFACPDVPWRGWLLFNATRFAARAAKPLEADLYESRQTRELLAEIHRNAEDAVRSALGVPAVGQGWLRETELYVRLCEALPGVEVIQHGVPLGFDRQHLDVWIPAWQVGVEYQGAQHFQPIPLFWGRRRPGAYTRTGRTQAHTGGRVGHRHHRRRARLRPRRGCHEGQGRRHPYSQACTYDPIGGHKETFPRRLTDHRGEGRVRSTRLERYTFPCLGPERDNASSSQASASPKLRGALLTNSPVRASKVPIDRGAAHPERVGNRRHGVLTRGIHLLGHLELVGGHDRGAATVPAAGPGGGQSCGGAFADEIAFEFSQGCEHVEDELAAGRGGVDRLLKAAEPNVALSQASNGVDQMPQGAAEAVEFPDDESVAGSQLVQDLLEGGAVGAGAAGRLGEHPIAAGTLQGVDLELGLLVGGGDAGIP
jgi:hypothetical protein